MGQSGLYQAIAMLLVAYFIICMTVLSVCAISTNGALDAGGAYCILFSPVSAQDNSTSSIALVELFAVFIKNKLCVVWYMYW